MLNNLLIINECSIKLFDSNIMHQPRVSFIWSFFTLEEEDPSKVKCNTCFMIVSRGSTTVGASSSAGTKKALGTSALHQHMRNHHPVKYSAIRPNILKFGPNCRIWQKWPNIRYSTFGPNIRPTPTYS